MICLTESNNYNTITETRTLYNGTDADTFITIPGLIPDSSYQVRVLGYNTRGNLLSDIQSVTMPQSSKSTFDFKILFQLLQMYIGTCSIFLNSGVQLI